MRNDLAASDKNGKQMSNKADLDMIARSHRGSHNLTKNRKLTKKKNWKGKFENV